MFDGKLYEVSEDNFENFVKEHIRKSPVFNKICKQFGVDCDLNDLKIILTNKLEKKFAETDGDEMTISKDALSDENDLSTVVFHEIYHYLKRRKEQNKGFFGDDEEIEAFQLSIANMLSNGMDMQYIQKHVFPKIRFHFNDEQEAIKFFRRLIQKAKELISV